MARHDPKSRVRVLVVDDFPDGLDLMAEYLTFRGFEVHTARNGEEAIETARQVKPAIVLMDLSMPGIDGWQATKILKADPQTKAICVIAVTAHALKPEMTAAKHAGCDGVISMPFDLAALAVALPRVLSLDGGIRQPASSKLPAFARQASTSLSSSLPDAHGRADIGRDFRDARLMSGDHLENVILPLLQPRRILRSLERLMFELMFELVSRQTLPATVRQEILGVLVGGTRGRSSTIPNPQEQRLVDGDPSTRRSRQTRRCSVSMVARFRCRSRDNQALVGALYRMLLSRASAEFILPS
jgi:CheY-like chemotaxis protein